MCPSSLGFINKLSNLPRPLERHNLEELQTGRVGYSELKNEWSAQWLNYISFAKGNWLLQSTSSLFYLCFSTTGETHFSIVSFAYYRCIATSFALMFEKKAKSCWDSRLKSRGKLNTHIYKLVCLSLHYSSFICTLDLKWIQIYYCWGFNSKSGFFNWIDWPGSIVVMAKVKL